MNDENSNDNPLDVLAEEYVARFRRGERPALTEFISRHPELADDIRDIFPTLVMMEDIRPGEADTITGSDRDGPRSPAGQSLERLGDYRILREVGRGGMGIVYEAEQESLGRHVALKVLPAHAMLDPRHYQRFQREARAAAGLHHTNIVPVFGVGEQDGLHYFVMQFITGLGLDEVLVELKRLRKPKHRTPRVPDISQTQEPSVEQIAAALLTGEFRPTADEKPEPTADGNNALGAGLPTPPKPPTEGLPLETSGRTSVPVGRPGHSAGRRGHSARTRFAPTDSSGVLLPGQRDNTSLSETGRTYWLSVARIGVQVADALAYANSQGVLHRDIKPSNLLLDTRGVVWVADFGLAKATDSDELTRTGDIVGTLRYLAPERLQGQSDVRGDLYSLGITLYEMLTLRSPFHDGDRARLVRQVANDEPPRPRAIEPAIPHDLETIVLKAIAKDPSDRYQTASALASDLRRFLEDKPIAARRFGPRELLWRWCRRNPVVAALSAAVAVLLVSAVVILSISNARIRGETAQKELALKTARENEELAERTAAEREQQRRIAVDRLYASQMNLAGQAFELGQLARVLDLLESQRPQPDEPDLRGFEWHYLWREIHRALHVSFRQTDGEVWCIAFSPDGTSLAVGSQSGEHGALKLWDVETGSLLATFEDDDMDVVSGLDFSPDGKFLASGSADERVRVWDVATRQLVARIGTNEVVRSIRWSRAGGLFAAGCQHGTVQVFDASSFDLRATIPTFDAPVLGLAFSGDGKRLVSSVAWGGPRKHSLIHDLTASPPAVLHDLNGFFVTDASPVDELVASYEDGVIHVWDPATFADRTRITAEAGWLNSVRFSNDAKRIATAGFDDRVATVWDCESGQSVVKGPHAQAVQVVAFDPQKRFWASASIDGEVKIWHYDVPSEAPPITHDPAIHRMFVLPRDRTLVLGGDFAAEGRDIDTSQVRNVTAVQNLRAISADGRVLVAAVPAVEPGAAETIEIWDQGTGKRRQSWRLPDPGPLYYENIALSNSGRLLATRAENLPLRIWAVSGEEPRQMHEFDDTFAMCLAFSPNEKLLVAGCQFGRVRLFDLESGAALPDLKARESGSGWALSVAFSPDGQRVAAGNSFGVARVWDVSTRRLVATLKGHLGEVPDLAFLPDSRRLAVASVGSIRLWDVEVGQELLSLSTPDVKTRFLAVTPDGQTLVSLDNSGTVRVWESRSRGASR